MFKTLLAHWRNVLRTKASHQLANQKLNTLSDHLLKDIGLCRTDLLAIKYGKSISKPSDEIELLPLKQSNCSFHTLQPIGE